MDFTTTMRAFFKSAMGKQFKDLSEKLCAGFYLFFAFASV